MKSIICLLICLLTEITNATTEMPVTVFRKDVVINAGQKAGFSGVLVPESRYREYSKAIELQPYCEEKIKACTDGSSVFSDAIIFFSGLGVGLLAGFLILK